MWKLGMMLWLLSTSLWAQTSLLAGPAQVTCEGNPVTLVATVYNPPAEYRLTWQGSQKNSPYLVTSAPGIYEVELQDLDSKLTYLAQTRVLLNSFGSDLNGDGQSNDEDWLDFYAGWNQALSQLSPGYDPDLDGRVTILDWFYQCNYERHPVNTPPELQELGAFQVYKNLQAHVDLTVEDLGPRVPTVFLSVFPQHGDAFLLGSSDGYRLFYDPEPGFVGSDRLQLRAEDGVFVGDPLLVEIEVSDTDTWATLFADVFGVSSAVNGSSCRPCHVEDQEGGLSLATYAGALQGGNSGIAGIVPFSPGSSRIYQRILSGEMPPAPIAPLTQAEIERIRIWIMVGAPEN